jgi:hypothetical protein
MPQVAHNNQNHTRQQRVSKIGLFLLFAVLSLGLTIWLFWSLKKKEMYRKANPPPTEDTFRLEPKT